ncbi:MAG: universal stress protein, partial [Bacteroidales bacterium]
MEEKKKLNIIAITDFSEYGETAVRHGAILATIFKASLTIITDFSFSSADKKNEKSFHSVDSIHFLNDLDVFHDHHLELFVLSDHFYPKKLFDYAEESNTTMLVIGVEKNGKNTFFSRKKAVQFIKPSRIP